MIRPLIPAVAAVLLAASAHAAPRPPIGAQVVWPNQPNLTEVLDASAAANSAWARFDLCWWGQVETTPGEYNFNPPGWPTDLAIEMIRDRGLEPFPILSYGNPLYDDEAGPSTDEGREAFAEYAYQAALRYRDEVTYWEIWNEPNLEQFWGREPDAEDYAKLVAVTAPRLREANPEAVIAGGSTSAIPFDYLTTCFQNGLLDHIDVLTVHPYREESPETARADYTTLRSLMAQYTDRDIPIWSGEWGYTAHAFNLSEPNLARVVARQLVTNLGSDIEVSIWFSMHPWSENGDVDPPAWGLVFADHSPRPAFHAFKTAVDLFRAGTTTVGDPFRTRVTGFSGSYERRFFALPSGETVVALWTPRWPLARTTMSPQRVTVRLRDAAGRGVRFVDGIGVGAPNATISEDNGDLVIGNFPMQDYPVYIVVEEGEKASMVVY